MKKQVEIKFRPQNQFPYLHDYSIRFPITDGTIFPYGDTIYCDEPEKISYDIMIHERMHLKRQLEMGVNKWIRKYLDDPEFRLDEEIIAYKYQLEEVKRLTNNDREELTNIRNECVKNLMSGLYGNIDYPTVLKRLGV